MVLLMGMLYSQSNVFLSGTALLWIWGRVITFSGEGKVSASGMKKKEGFVQFDFTVCVTTFELPP